MKKALFILHSRIQIEHLVQKLVKVLLQVFSAAIFYFFQTHFGQYKSLENNNWSHTANCYVPDIASRKI